MKLTNEELALLLWSLDCMVNNESEDKKGEKNKIELCKKLSKELNKRGYTTLISKNWIGKK